MAVRAGDLAYASVVYATVSDENGRNFKERPLVVLAPTGSITQDGKLVLACVTKQFTEAAHFVRLPHAPNGHPATGLREPSAAACKWLRALDPFDIENIGGFVPESYMERIVAQVRRLNATTLGDGRPIDPGRVRTPGQTERG